MKPLAKVSKMENVDELGFFHAIYFAAADVTETNRAYKKCLASTTTTLL